MDYTATITVGKTPHEVFDAINDVRGWSGADVDGSTDKLGDEFTFRGEDLHYSRIQVTELVAGRRVGWLVTQNYLKYVDDQNEWPGTRIIFEIAEQAGRTQLRFSHLGLIPDHECFGVCSNAWQFFIADSLRSLIETGTGKPIERHAGRIEAIPA